MGRRIKTAQELMMEKYDGIYVYANHIRRAAQQLVVRGKGEYRYSEQWSSGTTLWDSPDETDTVFVSVSPPMDAPMGFYFTATMNGILVHNAVGADELPVENGKPVYTIYPRFRSNCPTIDDEHRCNCRADTECLGRTQSLTTAITIAMACRSLEGGR